MATCLDIVRRALVRINQLPGGTDPPADQAEDALVVLQDLYHAWIGQGLFGRMTDVLVTSPTYTANEQERITCNYVGGAVTVTIPNTISTTSCDPSPFLDTGWSQLGFYGTSDYGFGAVVSSVPPRPPRDGAIIIITDINVDPAVKSTYIYDAPTARWQSIEGLGLKTEAPLGDRYRKAICDILAAHLAPEYGAPIDSLLALAVKSGLQSLAFRWDRARTTATVDYM